MERTTNLRDDGHNEIAFARAIADRIRQVALHIFRLLQQPTIDAETVESVCLRVE